MKKYILILCFALTGCIDAPVAPNLKFPETKCPTVTKNLECPTPTPVECPTPKKLTIKTVNLPPIPKDVVLSIHDGNLLKSNKGGELLIRYYDAAREAMKDLKTQIKKYNSDN